MVRYGNQDVIALCAGLGYTDGEVVMLERFLS